MCSDNGGCSSVGRAPDCDSGRRGFESHHPPHSHAGMLRAMSAVSCRRRLYGPLAQLVEQVTLNHLVVGSSPTRPTIATQCDRICRFCNEFRAGAILKPLLRKFCLPSFVSEFRRLSIVTNCRDFPFICSLDQQVYLGKFANGCLI
jgi:hypothetical protein